ncbi:MAG TPA: flagellar motor switch protein FliG, partial [Nitrospirota bacterium]
MANKGLKGHEKAAVLLSVLGEETAAQVLRNLNEEDIAEISEAFGRISRISKDNLDDVITDFGKRLTSKAEVIVSGEDFLKSAVSKVLGADKAKEIISRSTDFQGMESLKRLDARTIANFIKGEHPQTIALILSNIEAEQASQIIPYLHEEVQPEVILRMATMEGVPPSVLKEVEEVLRNNFQDATSAKNTDIGGVQAVANILNMVDGTHEEKILEAIEGKNVTLAESIRKLMFVFDDLSNVDDKSIQTLLREITTEELAIALKSAGESVSQKFFKNLSEKASQILQEDMEAKGPVRLSEVERAQSNIIKIARRLESE